MTTMGVALRFTWTCPKLPLWPAEDGGDAEARAGMVMNRGNVREASGDETDGSADAVQAWERRSRLLESVPGTSAPEESPGTRLTWLLFKNCCQDSD